MSDEHDRLREALAPLRGVEPRQEEVTAVLARAGARAERRPMRVALAALLVLLIVVGGTLAVPAGREATAAALDRLSDFLAGGEAPGERLPAGEPPNVLNWLGDARIDGPRLLARSGEKRLVAYRQQGTGQACFSLGRQVTECGDLAHWQRRFRGTAVLPLITTGTDARDRVALWGVATDAVAELELVYPDGRRLRPELGTNGFVVTAPAGRVPAALVARDENGATLARVPVADLQWRFSAGRGG